MLLDSFYENRAVGTRTYGVSRLSNRLSFYAYESRKLRSWQARALPLARPLAGTSKAGVYGACWYVETTQAEYVFSVPTRLK